MGKIAKTIQPKHKETLSPWLQEFVDTATSTPLPLLPKVLATFPSRWPFPRGDLYHWIPLLNRFDGLLEAFCSAYKLNDGPQTKDFGREVLLGYTSDDDETKPSESYDLSELGYGKDGDVQLIVAILKFTQMLLDHCGNRSIYASSPHLNDLLNSTDFTIICATLRVGVELAQRYQASVKRVHGMTTRQVHSALLTNHYNIDLDRVQQLAQPFVKTPLSKISEPSSLSTPASAKSKEKTHGGSLKNVATMYANDLCALAKEDTGSSGSQARWNGWGDVKLTYYPSSDGSQGSTLQSLPERGTTSNVPATPTPLRRSSTSGAVQSTPRANRQAASEDSPASASRSPAVGRDESSPPGQKSLEISQGSVSSASIYQLLDRAPADLPKETRYEFLNRLRVAKALMGSLESRRQALKARLLAIQNLAYIHTEPTFIEKVLRQDNDEPRRFQLVYQLAELIHPSSHGATVVPIDLQSIAFSLLEAISSFHHKLPDVFSALNATVNHGVLLYVIRKAVAGMKEDDIGEQWSEEDEWRDSLFSLTLNVTMSMGQNSRSMPEIISAGLLDIMVEILNIRSNIAERTYGTLVGFLDSLVYNVQSSFQTLIHADGLEAITNLVTHEVELAEKLITEGKGTLTSHRSQVVDYEIPFYQQQNLKFLLKFIHHLMSNAFAFGGNTDRLLRNLVDKSALLRSLRDIIENMTKFGSIVWTNAVIILSDFLNNDPTSFAAISEAGLVQSYLQALTGRPVPIEPSSGVDSCQGETRDEDNPDTPLGDTTDSPADLLEPDNRPHPPPQEDLEAPRDGLARGILPSSEPITIVPTVLNAISLNNLGMKMVVASRAFDSYFEIFESPEHVRLMATDETVAQNVGGNFDELARHHPSLRPAIANAVLDMVARVTYFAQAKARDAQWGAKLLVKGSDGRDVIADEALASEPRIASSEEKGKALATTADADVEMADASTQQREDEPTPDNRNSPSFSISPYVSAVSNFLSQYISNQNLKMNLINNGGIELLLDLSTSPSLPNNFGESQAARNLQSVISQLVESSPILGLPSLLKRTQNAVDALRPVTEVEEAGSYFSPFLMDDTSQANLSEEELRNRLTRGTELVKALLNTQSLIKTLYQCFPFSARAQTVTLHNVNVFDYYSRLVKSLGPLLRAVILEEAAISSHVPENWATRKPGNPTLDRQSSSSNAASSSQDDLSLEGLDTRAILTNILGSADFEKLANPSSANEGPSKSEQSSSRYQNFRTLRLLLHSLMPATFPLFQSLGKALLNRRERDSYLRVRHLQLSEELAQTILAQFDLPDRERSSKDFHYWIIMLHAAHEMMVSRAIETRSDRQSPTQIIAPVLIAFKKYGGLDVLNKLLSIYKDEICKEDKDGEEPSTSRLAVIGMKKILDLYSMAVSGKIITDSMNQINILPKNNSGDRRADSQVAPNLVVELRMAILPVVRELWDSPLAEKGSAHILAKIIAILRCISSADYENNAFKRSDKNPPSPYLQPTPQRFPWKNVADLPGVIEGIVAETGCDDDLAREGMYRANSVRSLATEYCRAHKSGVAGSRNPIPEEDSPDKADDEPAASGERVSQTPAEDDHMVLDLPSEFPPGILLEEGILNELRESVALSNGNDRDTPVPPLVARDDTGTGSSITPAQDSSTAADTETDNTERTAIAKEDLDEERTKLRVNLIDRCLDVIRAHPDSTHEVSELISMILRLPSDDASSRQEIGETLTNALLSFGLDEDLKSNGRSIAAYAHLLSLLLQEKSFFRATASTLRENVSQFLQFLKVPSPPSTEELPPWLPYVLLVFEILLSDDEQPGEIKWKGPSTENDPIEPLQWLPRDLNVKEEDRQALLGSILEILPRIGKEESLAISILRILVIFTRDRSMARSIGDKKNLQRLFVTAKQLSGAGSLRLNQTRIGSLILTILRHIVEDEEVIKQVMRSEIRSYFAGGRNARPLDPSGYIRNFSHLALRDPRLFIEVSNEIVKISRWAPPESNISRGQTILLKEAKPDAPKDDVAPTVRATEDLTIQDVKPSTENEDKQMAEASKAHAQDTKRPILENPDGVVYFLLCELLNYKEVDDKETLPATKESKKPEDPEESASDVPDNEGRAPDSKEKKSKPLFKTDEHPIFIYRCFLLSCLTELLQSYNRAKVEFINFKRSAPLFPGTPIRPRSSVLNYLLNDLLYSSHMDGTTDTIAHKKKFATSMQTQNLLVALVGRTGEKPAEQGRDKYDYDDEPDLLFVRKFVLDTVLKSYKDAATSSESFDSRYARMLALAEVMHLMMGDKDKDPTIAPRGIPESADRSQLQIRRLMYEKGYLATLTASIAEIDLAFPPVKRTIKYILRVLRILTSTAIHLSHSNIIPSVPAQENVDEETFSTSSLSDIDDDREETPDLYRNSALGMLEPGRDRDGDYSEDSDDDDDEEMYDDEYDDDMGYESEDREEDVSENDEEEDLEGMGPIEGLSGDHGVIEVTMEDDEDDDDDDMDEDDDEEGSEDDDMDSDEMDESDERIEIVDDEGNPLDDDGVSGWESDTDDDEEGDEDDDGEEIDFEAEAQDLEAAAAAGIRDIEDDDLGRFDSFMRAMDDDALDAPDDINGRYIEEEDEDEEDEDDDPDDDYAYEDDFANDPPPRDVGAASLGWDTLVVEPHGAFLGHHHRNRNGTRSPFPPIPFMMGPRDPMNNFGDPRGFVRGNRHDQRPAGHEDGLNPLLRRNNEAGRDGSPRPPHLGGLVRLGFPGGLFGGNIDSPMSFINDLVASLPASISRNGHAFHFQITQGPRGDVHDLHFPFGSQVRESRSDIRRETYQEPIQATSFTTEPTVIRWTDEVKMIFGSQHSEKSHRLIPALLSYLVPPAIQHEKELKAKEAERQRQQEEDRKKREEEERKAREAKEAEEKAAREKQEAEERERAAAESAAQAQTETATTNEGEQSDHEEPEAMEGVETSDEARAQAETQPSATQPRAFTTIRGEQVDVTELGIDPDYLEALPEEFREEVIAQTVSTRRAQAREAPRGSGEPTEVFQEFLDALPDELRLEIVQQERAEQRRREREEGRRQTAIPGQAAEAQEMDTASILMTFPPALREQVLMDQGADIIDALPPDLAAQARRLVRTTNPVVHHERASSGTSRPRDGAQAGGAAEGDRPHRKTVVQMLDKPGVYTLLRLMFINMKGGSLETSLRNLFKDVCENRQTRFEVVSNLLKILQEGSTDVDAVERSFASLSIKARQPKDLDPKTQTPQNLKRTYTNISSNNPAQGISETSPLLIVQQCLDLLCYLADQNIHVPSLFLTEHDGVSTVSIKRTLSRKGKGKDIKASKYAINSLLALLDRDLVMESSSIMDSLSQLLSRVTGPLLALDRKQKEAAEAMKSLESQTTNTAEPSSTTEPADPTATTGDSADALQSTDVESSEQTGDQTATTTNASENAPPAEADSSKATEKQAMLKRIKQLHPPVIPVHNLTLIIKIFVARECSSKTFKETLSTIKNLSVIPGAMLVFGEELARQAQLLSEKIVVHLDDLLPHIQSAASGTEIQGVALAKFSPGASDQNKLLRVLTALDHLFAQKKSDSAQNSDSDETKKQDLLATLYRNPTFNALWEKLSACLSAIRQRESLLNVATILLPLIEALMVVCKDTAQGTNSQNKATKELVMSSPQPESHLAGLFFTFTEEHRRILNELVRNNPSLMKGTFSHLVKNPKVLEFDNKRNWFNRSVHNKSNVGQRPHPLLQLQVRREHVFHDSFRSLYFKSGDEIKFGKLSIRFHGEEGVDAGGVTREWFQVLARQMFDANYALFVPVSSDRTTFHPNKLSGINDEHLSFFKFIGRIIGKALYEGRLLDCYFSRAVYKRILGKPVSVKDMESFDPDYYKSLSWMLNNDITDIITETFSVQDDEFGVINIHDLIPDGRNVPVTEENKHEYVRLVVEHKLLTSVKDQMENFLKGFHEIIPAELISIFNEQELELLISGLPDVDIDDWKSNTEYHNYTPSSPQIQWFWRAMRSFDKEERAKLLQFVTGTSKVPLNGFKELEGMNGINRFNIHRDYGNKERLPSSHTCFNQLDLPEYESYDILRKQVLKAITAGSDYFGFA